MGEHGIKETKDVLIAVLAMGLVTVKHLRDGLQAGKDFFAIFNETIMNEEFRQKAMDAYNGIGNVPAEVNDIDLAEVGELTDEVAQFLKDLGALLAAQEGETDGS